MLHNLSIFLDDVIVENFYPSITPFGFRFSFVPLEGQFELIPTKYFPGFQSNKENNKNDIKSK